MTQTGQSKRWEDSLMILLSESRKSVCLKWREIENELKGGKIFTCGMQDKLLQ